jgi:hypothetical protein
VAVPCWQTLLSDSYDGRVDHRYPPACFHEAIAHIPPVVAVYSGTRDELLRALQLQLEGKGPVGPVVARATGAGGVPLPLVALGALALLLLAVGLGGTAWRRVQARRGG